MQTNVMAFDKVANLLRYHNKDADNGMLYQSQITSDKDLLFGVAICGQTYNTDNYRATPFLSVDLDLKLNKLGYTDGKELVSSFIEAISKLWLAPHWYILTGNGGHVFWNLENNFSNQINHIRSIYSLMSKKTVFHEYGVDPTSYRLIKFSRVPGSWSSKNNCRVEGYELSHGYYAIKDVLNSVSFLESAKYTSDTINNTLKYQSIEKLNINHETIAELVDLHGRNIALFNLLLHYKKSGYTSVQLKERFTYLYKTIADLKPEPFTLKEAKTVLSSVLKTKVNLYPSKQYDQQLLLQNLDSMIFYNSKTKKPFDVDGQKTVKSILVYLIKEKLVHGYFEFNVALSTIADNVGLTKQTIGYYMARLENYFIKVDNTFIIAKRGKGYRFTETFIENLTANT